MVTKVSDIPYRPELPKNETVDGEELLDLMFYCLDEDPQRRTSFSEIRRKIKSLNKER